MGNGFRPVKVLNLAFKTFRTWLSPLSDLISLSLCQTTSSLTPTSLISLFLGHSLGANTCSSEGRKTGWGFHAQINLGHVGITNIKQVSFVDYF